VAKQSSSPCSGSGSRVKSCRRRAPYCAAHLSIRTRKALEAVYTFPLPRDAALRAFRIAGEGFEAHSELKETEAAVKAYEEGIAQGSPSTLARQYGDGDQSQRGQHPAGRDCDSVPGDLGRNRATGQRLPVPFSLHSGSGLSSARQSGARRLRSRRTRAAPGQIRRRHSAPAFIKTLPPCIR